MCIEESICERCGEVVPSNEIYDCLDCGIPICGFCGVPLGEAFKCIECEEVDMGEV